MSRIIKVFPVFILMLFLMGCTTTTYIDQPSTPVRLRTSTELEPQLSVGPKIEGMATVKRIFFFFVTGPGRFAEGVAYDNGPIGSEVSSSLDDIVAMARAAAAYKACAENRADVIIYPRYIIRVSDYFFYKKATARVIGYRGIIHGVKAVNGIEKAKEERRRLMYSYLKELKSILKGIKDQSNNMVEINSSLKDINTKLKKLNSSSVKKSEGKRKKEMGSRSSIGKSSDIL